MRPGLEPARWYCCDCCLSVSGSVRQNDSSFSGWILTSRLLEYLATKDNWSLIGRDQSHDPLFIFQPLLSLEWVKTSPIWYVGETRLCGSKKRANFGGYNYDPVQSILIIFSKLFVNDHKSCLVVKFSTSPHIYCHYTLWNTMLYFALITLLIAKNAPTSDHHNFNKC